MPRARREASAWVPATGRPARNRRRAASGDPPGTGGSRVGCAGSERGRQRKRRASPSASRKVSNPRLREIRSRRSPAYTGAGSDRKRVVLGQKVVVLGVLGGRSNIKKK